MYHEIFIVIYENVRIFNFTELSWNKTRVVSNEIKFEKMSASLKYPSRKDVVISLRYSPDVRHLFKMPFGHSVVRVVSRHRDVKLIVFSIIRATRDNI